MFDEKLVFGSIGGSVAIAVMLPEYSLLAVGILSAILGIFWWQSRITGANKLMEAGMGRTLLIWIDKQRRITLQWITAKAEGYMALEKFGVVKNTSGSDYSMCGKRCLIGMEGIAHTIDVRWVKLTQKLKEEGYRLERDSPGQAKEEAGTAPKELSGGPEFSTPAPR